MKMIFTFNPSREKKKFPYWEKRNGGKMKEKFKNRKKEITIIFIIVIILIFFFSGFSMGKGYSKNDINGNTEIAKPIIQVENGNSLEINNQNKEGIYEFKVKNYNDNGEITQVDMEYYVEILDDLSNKGIDIKLLKDDEEIEINENKTEKYLLTKEGMQEDNYKLELKYDENKNISIEDVVEQLQIKVHSEQKQEVQ